MTTTPTPPGPPAPRRDPWRWVAAAAAAALAAVEIRRLVVLVGWERTLPFARDFLPAAIATSAMGLAACLLILLLLFTRRRKWGLCLAIGWGAITLGAPLWPHAKNLWYQLAWRLHLTDSLRHVIVLGGHGSWQAYAIAGLGALLALSAAIAFAKSPRDRIDRGILLASLFYAAFYFLATGVVARLVTPH
jgi:hypothetical protein